ncbi:modulator of levamisole receptor-1 domain-containing protein [Ditylenchus destructor]|nr:modulator of levamisole receptor-1 domain-containing protein [Ditylenchus destructor]
MSSIPHIFIFLFLLLTLATAQQRVEWEASTYPNPTADGYARCNMKSPSAICDPDAVLSEAQRYRINYEMTQLEARTRQVHGSNFCEKKGIVAAIALAKHVRGASENAVKMMANDILRKWSLDKQCSKSLVIVVATEDRKFWVARDSRVPVYATEFTDIFNAQKPLFKDGNYPQALLNILESTWDKALEKQGTGDGTSRGTPFSPGDGGRQRPIPDKPHKPSASIFPSIPMWVWIALVLIVIPTLCCCCCLYFCCFRKKGNESNNRRQGPSDLPDEEGYGGQPPPRRGFGGGGGLNNIIGGIGAGAIGNSIGNWFRNKRGGGGGDQPPPAYPGEPTPTAPGQPGHKGGLYPSKEVKDDGGGGSW